MNKCFIFHDYQITHKGVTTLTRTNLLTGSSREEPVSYEIEKCNKCGHERAYVTDFRGDRTSLNPEILKYHI